MVDATFYPGSIKAGWFTAQLGSGLSVSSEALILKAAIRAFVLKRKYFLAAERTSILGLFKRGVRFVHDQPDLPSPLVFYPSIGTDALLEALAEHGWTQPDPPTA